MKKFIIGALLVALSSVAASAQVYLGGTLGVATSTIKIEDESQTSTTFTFAPEVGYNFNDMWAVGTSVGIQGTSVGGNSSSTFVLCPYVRATFAHVGPVRFFAEGAVEYDKSSDTDGWGIGLRPGMLVDISKKVSLIGRTVLVQYSSASGNGITVSQTGFAIGNNLSIGVIFTL